MTENNFNMERFHHSIYLDKPVSEVYKMAATPAGISKWFIGEAAYSAPDGITRKENDFIQEGDSYNWHWLAKDLSLKGKVLKAQKDNLVEFTFGNLFRVTITINEDKGRTIFTLAQQYVNGAVKNNFAYINCCVCWVFFITNLKSVLEYGNDLRETQIYNEELVNR
jgi:uncharacterized protein YndB with AHSA1/START domain